MYSRQKLSNGLALLTSPMPGVKSICAMVMVGAGSRYETRKINGLSHFLEHMAFKGTKKRPSAKAISQEIDAIGGEFNAFTSKDHTAFFVKAASEHLPLILDLLSDMLTNSLFKREEIEREKGVIIEEINMYEDTPMRKVSEVFENLIYGDTPMGWDIAGKAEIIRSIKREDFVRYVDSLYKTRNMVVSIAGGISDKVQSSKFKVQSLVEQYFGKLGDGSTKSFEKIKLVQDKPRVRVHFKKTEQAHLCLGFPAISNDDPRRYALSVLTTILGGGMSSRLFTEVRERRALCYYIHASNDSYKDTGDFVVSAGVDLSRIDEAIKTILKELFKFEIRNPKFEITREEFRKAKEYIKGHMILGLEDSESVAGLYASQFLLKEKIETPEEIMKKIEEVTMEEVYSVARDIFDPKKVNLAVIGPFEDKGKFEKLLI